MLAYRKLKDYIFSQLEGLPKNLYYHGIHHTKDVANVCEQYIRRERLNSHDRLMLRVAALIHDIGFLVTYKDHEARGFEMMQPILIEYGFSIEELKKIEGLVMATKVPQNPLNHLEAIICDADLDYLGRKDFPEISESLFAELQQHTLLSDRMDWLKLQVSFLEKHTYHTTFARRYRTPNKLKQLAKIKAEMDALAKKKVKSARPLLNVRSSSVGV